MVFTVRVRRADHGLSRRGVLAAAVGGLATLGLGACDIGRTTIAWHTAPDVLLPFLASTVALADKYDAAMRILPSLATRLTPLRDAHRQHVTALRRELGLAETSTTAPVATPSATPSSAASSPATPPPTSAPPTSAPPRSAPPTSAPPTSAAPTSASSSSAGGSSGAVTPAPTGTSSAPALPSDRDGLLAALRRAEQQGQQDATAACLTAPSYRAALLGSIAACRATHQLVLA